MSLIKWSPFFEPFDSVEKFIDNYPTAIRSQGLVPAIDVYDSHDTVVIETALPGVDPKKVELSIENNVLTISGSSERKTEVDEKEYYRKEIRSGSFIRQVSLPSGVKENDAAASFKDGILKIVFPKTHLELPKKININVSTGTN
jgi:HSP20 family protein